MSGRKKLIITLISVAVVVALAVSAILIIPGMSRQEVEVYPVSRIREYAWGDMFGSYGNIMAGNMQAVYLNSDLLLLGIDVDAGDAVKSGDVLLRYDTTIQDLKINTVRIQNEILKNRIRKAERELSEIESLTPSSPPEPPPAPGKLIVDGAELTPDSMLALKVSGDGKTEKSRMVFNCLYGVTIDSDFLASLYAKEPDDGTGGEPGEEPEIEPVYIEFRVFYYNDVLMFKWEYDSNSDFDPASRPDGWDISRGVQVNEDQSVTSSKVDRIPGSRFRPLADTVDYIGGPHYSKAEIDRMRNGKVNELANYKTELKMGELELETALAELGDGAVKSLIDGIVSEVRDPDELEAGVPVIVIQSGKGYRVEGTVSELNLNRIEIGQTVSVSSWMTGGSYVAEITEIQDFPTRNYGGSMGMENPLSSFYTFVAMIDTTEVLMVGDWVEIAIEGETAREPNPSTIYIPNAFIREEAGRSYVMKADEDLRLVKRYVVTGKTLYGYATEIKAGITLDDSIAFPYGKAVKEGAPVTVAEGMYW